MAASLQFILARLYQNVSQVVRKWERPDEVSMSRLSVSDLHSWNMRRWFAAVAWGYRRRSSCESSLRYFFRAANTLQATVNVI